MKHTKTIIIASVAALAMTVGIAVSCNKDANEQKDKSNQVKSGTRGSTTLQDLSNAMFQYWHLSDSACRVNPGGFYSICQSEDYDDFYLMTGITSSLINTIDILSRQELTNAVTLLGDSWVDTTECLPCVEGKLKSYGNYVESLRAYYNALKLLNSPDTLPVFEVYMDSCDVLCRRVKHYYNNMDELNCLFNCNMRRALEQARSNYYAITNRYLE